MQTPVKRAEKTYHWEAFGCDVLVIEPTMKTVEDLATEAVDVEHKRLKPNYLAMKMIVCVYDPSTRKPLFSKVDRQWLNELPASVTSEISAIIENLGAPTPEEVGAAEKNLETTRS
jgi:hypothetical protein